MKIAQIPSLFGTIAPPPGSPRDLGALIALGINLFIIFAGFMMLIYLLMGAYDWIVSSGDKEKLVKAQNKITNAVVGMFLIILMLALWNAVVTYVLHLTKPGEWIFKLPQL